jgi:hypothetical protein
MLAKRCMASDADLPRYDWQAEQPPMRALKPQEADASEARVPHGVSWWLMAKRDSRRERDFPPHSGQTTPSACVLRQSASKMVWHDPQRNSNRGIAVFNLHTEKSTGFFHQTGASL